MRRSGGEGGEDEEEADEVEDGFFAAFSRTGEGGGDAFSCRWLLLPPPWMLLLLSGG